MAIRRGRGHSPPPQQTTSAVVSQAEDDDDDIVALDEAPQHLRAAPAQAPIIVLSDSDSDSDVGLVAVQPSDAQETHSTSKRRMSSSIETSSTAHAAKRPRLPESPQAGPSTGPTTPPAAERILPKAEYLVPSVLEIIPDLCPVWAAQQLEALIQELSTTSNVPGQDAVQRTIEMAFEMESYPAPAPEKPEEIGDYAELTYRIDHRRGAEYDLRAIDLLQDIFATIPLP